ncbi:MAG: Ni/Fe hydrogenase subunit alpha [Byssovorax sp.]
MASRTIQVDYLSRVEGEGALLLRFEGKHAKEVQLRIFEPPRFFEALLRGRAQLEAPDITARICGICPVAYQMSACQAIEDAHRIAVEPAIKHLRRLLYCGEWIESHVLHMVMLHAPDFLGFPDALTMAREHGDAVKRGLRMKKAGNAIVALLGGREIHPINVRVGGFYRSPSKRELESLLPELYFGLQAALENLRWVNGFSYPDFERDYELVALHHPDEYAVCEGRLVSNKGLDIDVHDYESHFEEQHLPHSNALHSIHKGHGAYLCGPLARMSLNFEQIRPVALDAAREVGFSPPCKNPFRSLIARAIETIHAFDLAIDLIERYTPPIHPFVEIPAGAGLGRAVTEAPRGLLYHRYVVDDAGLITDATIVPPTSQNQKTIEEDLFDLAPALAEMPHAEAQARAEQAIRNYDPCISCATHFLTLTIERSDP